MAASCRSSEKAAFIDLIGDHLILLVELERPDDDLGLGLLATATGATEEPQDLDLEAMPFETRSSTFDMSPSSRFRQKEEFSYITLRWKFDKAPYFIVPLRKRPVAGKPFAHRISVGRARNNDIVLRHSSVSKFHAWFETGGHGEMRVADARSSNGTLLNDDALGRELAIATEGDVIKFGSIVTMLCTAPTLWEALH
jgi:hypothetical protein